MTQVIALGLAAETMLFALAGFFLLWRLGYTIAEAGAGGILLLFMALSLIHQVDIFIGSPWPGLVLELIILVGVLTAGVRRRHLLAGCFRTVGRLIGQEQFACLIIAGGWAVMAILAGIGYGVAEFQSVKGGEFGWLHGNMALWSSLHPIPPLNAPALFYHTSRFGLAPGACGFGVLAHMAVGFSTYALARRYAWPPMALTITLMVVSMPRMVRLAMHPCAELISVAAIVVCVLLLYRLVEQHLVWDLYFFLLCLSFSIDAHPMSLALVLVLLLLLTVVMMRRHGWLLCRELIIARPIPMVMVVLLTMGLVQVPVFALNLVHGHPLLGRAVVFDTDGIIGATANLIRYLFISIDPTEAVRNALVWLVGLDLKQVMTGLYNMTVVSLFGRSGASAEFVPVFSGSGPAGFGPVAALLVLPAMVHAALRGPRRLKALSVAWLGYLYLAALILAWTADNLIVLSPLYVANGFMVAFFLPPWRLRRRGMRLLQVLFVLLLVLAVIGNR
ncbi:uncharacterized protein Dvar_19160 [Desulfosarcina variabilis str. Montpellier]|uniref:hypothetical protein n=1 Tax=Desulfosarcina variabilis TaxID=2300 RepID=UPI003AFB55B3